MCCSSSAVFSLQNISRRVIYPLGWSQNYISIPATTVFAYQCYPALWSVCTLLLRPWKWGSGNLDNSYLTRGESVLSQNALPPWLFAQSPQCYTHLQLMSILISRKWGRTCLAFRLLLPTICATQSLLPRGKGHRYKVEFCLIDMRIGGQGTIRNSKLKPLD